MFDQIASMLYKDPPKPPRKDTIVIKPKENQTEGGCPC